MTLVTMYDQLRQAAELRDLDDDIGDIPDLTQAIIAYADALGVPVGPALSGEFTAQELIEEFVR